MKRLLWTVLAVLTLILPASAQDWKVDFFEDFDNNNFGWPLGEETQGTTSINRVIRDSAYIWTVTTQDPNISWMALNPGYPESSERFRFTAEIRLPEFDPLSCAGLLLDGQADSFYGFVICNDKTYSLLRSSGGTVETLIPYSPIRDYDSFSAFTMSAEINNGWVDLSYNGENLDTYNIGFNKGSFGLIAMPQTTESTELAFGALFLESTSLPQETTFNPAAIDPNTSENTARLVKMLNMKERITSTAGTFFTLPDKETSLAMMGYSSRESLGFDNQDLLLQTDITWASGYERPDYAASGCGFFLRGADENTFIEIYAAMDGAVYANAYRYGIKTDLIALKYGHWSIAGSGRLAVAADDQKITILWNDSILGTITERSLMWSGDAGYIVHSGTNGDFGTRCTFSNGEGYLFE